MSNSDESLLVDTSEGPVLGHTHVGRDATPEFLGIPYAATTGGQNRFRPPQPRAPWSETYIADKPGPDALSLSRKGPVFMEPRGQVSIQNQSEDCLFLNVWTPSVDSAKRPVMVWIHGGGLMAGSANKPHAAGNHLATHGDVVVVSVNYRLAAAGMLAHPALTDPETGYFANWNLQDWLAAGRWIQRNIAGFGGDPDNVTFFGCSGGSFATNGLALTSMEHRKGLYRRIIGMSGDPSITPMSKHQQQAEKLFEAVGCTPDNALAFLRAMPEKNFRKAFANRVGWLAPDGIFLKSADPIEAVRQGATQDVDIMGGDDGLHDISSTLQWDFLAAHNAAGGGRGYRYHLVDSPGIKAGHASDVPLAFGNWDLQGYRDRDPEEPSVARVSGNMLKAFSNFARSGDPSFRDERVGEVSWPLYTEDEYKGVVFGEKPAVAQLTPKHHSYPPGERPQRARRRPAAEQLEQITH